MRSHRRTVLTAGLAPARTASPELSAALRADDLTWLPHAAVFHGVAPALHLVLQRSPGASASVMRALESRYHGSVADHLGTLQDLGYLDGVLGSAGVPWLVLKGPVLGELYYARPDVRPYSDLDILVGPGALGAALDALVAGGCRLGQPWPDLADGPPGEVQVELPSGRWLDVHWHLINMPRVRRCFAVDIRPLFDRSRRVALGQAQVLTLGPADTLAHLLLHGGLSGGDRLVWMKDVALCAEREGTEVVDEARAVAESWGAGLLADVYLQRVHATCCDAVRCSLGPAGHRRSPWLGLARLADRAVAVTSRDGGPTLARVLARSTRGGDLASVAELARKAWLNVAERPPLRWWRAQGDATAPMLPVAERRSAFLVAVERASGSGPSATAVVPPTARTAPDAVTASAE